MRAVEEGRQAAERSGQAQGFGIAFHLGRRTGIADGAPAQKPGIVTGTAVDVGAVVVAQRHAPGMVRRDFQYVGAQKRDERVGGGSPDRRRASPRPQRFQMVFPGFSPIAVQFGEQSIEAGILDQVEERLVAVAAGARLGHPAEFLAQRIHHHIRDATLGVPHQVGARIAERRPAAPLARGPRRQRIGPLPFPQPAVALVLETRHQVGAAELPAPDGPEPAIARIFDGFVGGREVQSLEMPARGEIHHAAQGIRAVKGGGAFLEHLHPFDGDQGHDVDVHETSADQAGRQIHLAPAVDQHQRP